MGHTKKHIILEHLAKSKGLRRKDLVTFICINNGYEGHKQGYYTHTIAQWVQDGYIVKKGNKLHITPLGKTYLKTPKVATLKAKVNYLRDSIGYWKDSYYEVKQNHWAVESERNELRKEFAEAKEEIARLKANDATYVKIEMLYDNMRDELAEVNEDRDNLIKEVEELKAELSEAKAEISHHKVMRKIATKELADAISDRDAAVEDGLYRSELLEELRNEILQLRGTSPSTDYSEFSKAELIAIIKRIL